MSLRSFLAEMNKKHEIKEIEEEVSTRFEISAIMKESECGPIL